MTNHDELVEKAFEHVAREEPFSFISRADIRHWVDMFESLGWGIHPPTTSVQVNRWAQFFYEESGLSYILHTDKPQVVQGLKAVLRDAGLTVAGESNE